MRTVSSSTIFALDVGERRIGVARANVVARLAAPLTTYVNTPQVIDELAQLFVEEGAVAVVVGLPRDMRGEETEQTRQTQQFAEQLRRKVEIPLHYQDEAVTSVRAESELNRRGKKFGKEDIDALAATYILEDFLREHPEVGL